MKQLIYNAGQDIELAIAYQDDAGDAVNIANLVDFRVYVVFENKSTQTATLKYSRDVEAGYTQLVRVDDYNYKLIISRDSTEMYAGWTYRIEFAADIADANHQGGIFRDVGKSERYVLIDDTEIKEI